MQTKNKHSFDTNDQTIRSALKAKLEALYKNDPEHRIIEELGINHGSVRADVAVVNGILDCYEIKSEYCDMVCRDEGYSYKEAEECGAWKGDKASYSAKHKWVASKYTKSEYCDDCGRSGIPIEWANISGEYHRERDDWRNLCKKCHFEYDKDRHANFKRY